MGGIITCHEVRPQDWHWACAMQSSQPVPSQTCLTENTHGYHLEVPGVLSGCESQPRQGEQQMSAAHSQTVPWPCAQAPLGLLELLGGCWGPADRKGRLPLCPLPHGDLEPAGQAAPWQTCPRGMRAAALLPVGYGLVLRPRVEREVGSSHMIRLDYFWGGSGLA